MPVRIGVTTSYEAGEQRLHRAYVLAVERAGALPLLVPLVETEAAVLAFAELLDGLVITGGPAVTEGLVGDLPGDLAETDPVRAAADRRILRAFLDRGKPVLGICYGMQLMNALAGGTLYADVQRQQPGALAHSPQRGAETHALRVEPGSHLFAALQASEVEVNTRHLQAVASVGAGFRVAATAPDGTVEAIENEEGTLLGVQFHPERMGDEMLPVFRHLVERALAGRAATPAAPP